MPIIEPTPGEPTPMEPTPSSPVTIKYKGTDIAAMDDSGTKTIKTSGKYCEADIEVVYVASDTPTPTQDKGVFFLDYDGTVVETWATADVSGKTALPPNPSHTALVAQGWNWDLASIKSYIASYPNANVYVGQMYKTASGLTEIDVTVTKVTGLTVTCQMAGTKSWGDGTTDSSTSHTYTEYGDYTITCAGTSIPAGSYSNGGMFKTSSSNMNRFWCTAVRIGENVTSIGDYAFQYCYSLTNITIPNGVTSIGNYAFSYCYSLTNITIPNGVTSINSYVFYYCCSLTNIVIPNGVTSIGSYAFYQCYLVTTITIPNEVTSISIYAFQNCYSVTNITIPNGVTSIGNYAFQNCYSLTNITIPDRAISIGTSAFSYCYSLTNITIPNRATSIGNYAFQNCYSVTNITIPNGVTSIGTSAFSYCYSAIEYNFTSATTVPTLANTNAFNNINGICKILVPSTLLSSWKSATNWTTYANYIYGV